MPRIDKYEVVSRIARGGMAEVFLGWFDDQGKRVPVAIKRILPEAAEDKDVVIMLVDEARISARLVHSNIARLLDMGRMGNTVYLVVEYVDGRELRAVLDALAPRKERVPPIVLAYVLQKAAEGLDYAHGLADTNGKPFRIVHRDMSPANLMVRFDGDVKVIDFGIARAADRMTKTMTGVVKGKYRYMSPEQALAKPTDHRADLYSLGVILYEGLAGHPVLPKMPEHLVSVEAAQGKIPTLDSIGVKQPAKLVEIATRAMQIEPLQRQATAGALALELAEFVKSQGGEAVARTQLSSLMMTLFPGGVGQLARSIGK